MLDKLIIKDDYFFDDFEADLSQDDFVLLIGKNGTGKSLLGHSLSFSGRRRDAPLLSSDQRNSVKKEFIATQEIKDKLIEIFSDEYDHDSLKVMQEKDIKNIEDFFGEYQDKKVTCFGNPWSDGIVIKKLGSGPGLNWHFFEKLTEVVDASSFCIKNSLFNDYFIKENNDMKSLHIRKRVAGLKSNQTLEDINISSESHDYANVCKSNDNLDIAYEEIKILLENINFSSAEQCVKRLKDEIFNVRQQAIKEGGISGVSNNLSNSFSYGENFILSLIAMLTIKQPLIVFFDDAEYGLHPELQLDFFNFLKNLKKKLNLPTQFFISSHSPYIIKGMLGKTKVLHLHKEDDVGKMSINILDKNIKTFAKINYKVFNIPSEEYHLELFADLTGMLERHHKKEILVKYVNYYLLEKENLATHKRVASNNYKPETLPVYIRNAIHHPENKERKYNLSQLIDSIKILEQVLSKGITVHH